MSSKPSKEEIKHIIVYALVGFISFGYAWNHPTEWDQQCLEYGAAYRTDPITKEVKGGNVRCSWVPALKSVIAGIAWPIYLPGVAAIKITQWMP